MEAGLARGVNVHTFVAQVPVDTGDGDDILQTLEFSHDESSVS